VAGVGAGGFEVGSFQIEVRETRRWESARRGPLPRCGELPTAGDEDGDGVIVGREILEGEAAGGVAQGRGVKGVLVANRETEARRGGGVGRRDRRAGRREGRGCEYPR